MHKCSLCACFKVIIPEPMFHAQRRAPFSCFCWFLVHNFLLCVVKFLRKKFGFFVIGFLFVAYLRG